VALRNTPEQFGALSKLLHWLIAVLIIGLIALGWYMVDLTYYDRWYNTSLELHKALGMLALVLAVTKITWTLGDTTPEPAPTIRPWELRSAHAMHRTLYVMMLLLPLTGYVISTSAGDPISFFGLFGIPALIPQSDGLRDLAVEVHYYAAYATAALIALHVLAAFKHEFIDRDGTLRKML